MKRIVLWCTVLCIVLALGGTIRAIASPVGTPPQAVPVSDVDVEGVSVSQLAVMVFRDIMNLPFVLSPEVYADTRPLAVHIKAEGKLFFTAVVNYFNALGYAVERKAGVLSVAPLPPLKEKVERKEPPPRFNRVYRPKFREVAYLVDLLRPLVPEVRFGSDRGVARGQTMKPANQAGTGGLVSEPTPEQMAAAGPASALGQVDRAPDVMVYNGVREDLDVVADLLPELDTPQGELLVRATVYEVSVDKSEASAVALAAQLVNARVGLFLNGAITPQQDAVTIKLTNLEAVISALDQDHRFKVLSSPVARARSGSPAVFQSGQEVPVLGAVSYQGAATGGVAPVQSVQYRAAGVIFHVLPVQRQNVISVDVQQELSDFVQTTTGVNNSPTLNKRSLQSSLSVQAGDVVLLGGLLQDKQTGNSQGLFFLPSFLDAVTSGTTRSEILLVLQVLPAEQVPSIIGTNPAGPHLVVPAADRQ